MIKSIGCKNYKAFSEAELELKPITILLGANSSGKSSLLKLLLMIEQTININEKYQSALKLNGHYVGMGEPANIFKDRDMKDCVEIEFGLDAVKYCQGIDESYKSIKRIVGYVFLYLWAQTALNVKPKDRKTFHDFISYHNVDIDVDDIDIPFFQFGFMSEKRKIEDIQYVKWYLECEDVVGDIDAIDKLTIDDLVLIYNSFSSFYLNIEDRLKSANVKTVYLSYCIRCRDNQLDVISASVHSNNSCLIKICVDNNSIQSDFWGSSMTDSCPFSPFSLSFACLKPTFPDKVGQFHPTFSFMCSLLSVAYSAVADSFLGEKISYISPLRAYPQRYYLLDESNDSQRLRPNSGTSVAEILKKKVDISSSVNKWFKNFGLSVSVKEFRDIINNINVEQNGNSLDITDVGFGISQVLPVIVQCFLAKNDSLTIIEQPEIHLHPKLQAELTDLFIDVACHEDNKDEDEDTEHHNKIFLIETHSEYMIKRLRRRMAEGSISPSDVALYYIEPRKKKNEVAQVYRIPISEIGEVDWPSEYYGSALADDLAYVQAVVNSRC